MSKHQFSCYLNSLPRLFRNKIERYRFWNDAQSCLIGKLLLNHSLIYNNLESIKSDTEIKFSEYKKPFLTNEKAYFNISHTEGCVVCAICMESPIGIDIEKIKPIKLEDFKTCFTPSEWTDITNNVNTYDKFYDYWTRKESYIKAVGKGLSMPLSEISVIPEIVSHNNNLWKIFPISIDSNYRSNITTLFEAKDTLEIKTIRLNLH